MHMFRNVIFILTLITASYANALIVSDPGAYAKLATQIDEAKKLVDSSKENLAEIRSLHNAMTGNYIDITDLTNEVQNYQNNFKNISKITDTTFSSNPKTIRAELDSIFTPGGLIGNATDNNKLKQQYREISLKASLENAQMIINETESSLDRITTLSTQAENTENLKAALDVNNKLLADLAIVSRQLLTLKANETKAYAAMQYNGTNSNITRIEPSKASWVRQYENIFEEDNMNDSSSFRNRNTYCSKVFSDEQSC